MTQVTDAAEVEAHALRAPFTIPRPRAVRFAPALEPAAPPALAVVTPVTEKLALTVAAIPVTPEVTVRRTAPWPALVVDLGLALLVAGTSIALGRLSLALAAGAAVAWPLALLTAGRYRQHALGQGRLHRVRLVVGTGAKAVVLALATSPWLTTVDVVSLALLIAVFAAASSVPPLVGARRRRPRVVLAGRPRDVRDALRCLSSTSSHEVVAACLTRTSKEPLGDLPTYVGFGGSSAVAQHHRADALVVLPGARLAPVEIRRLHWSLAGVGTELYLGTGLLDVEPQRTRVVSTSGLDVLHVTQPVLHGPRRLLKDVVERLAALVALALVSPLLAALCLAIRLETPGPALFRQQRMGRDGVPFTMLKFRSMGIDAEAEKSVLVAHDEGNGILFKMRLDPRITPLGATLRRYSLDELPQLWNVVRGDMSLVGPRPALPSEVARYDLDPRRRLVVKPGVTGLWQVSGRSDLSWDESVRLDLKYVDNWSLRLDLMILVRTVRAVLGHRGAY